MGRIESVQFFFFFLLFRGFVSTMTMRMTFASSPLPRLLASTEISWRQQKILSLLDCAF